MNRFGGWYFAKDDELALGWLIKYGREWSVIPTDDEISGHTCLLSAGNSPDDAITPEAAIPTGHQLSPER